MLPNTYDDKASNLLRYFQDRIPNFFIDEKMQKALCFRERLEVFYKNNSSKKLEPIGKYFISVENIGPRSQEFLVQVSLTMRIQDHLIESKITSSATKELYCIEEKKYESLKLNNTFCEKNIYIGRGDDSYFINITENSIDDWQSKVMRISYSDTMFLSDGSSVILMRYLAMTGFCGTLCFDLVTTTGTIVKCQYQCSCENMELNDEKITVFQIIQTFCTDDSISSTIKTTLSQQGNVLSVISVDSPYVVKINPHIDYCIHHQKPINLPLKEEWKEDFEMVSKNIDKKVSRKCRKKEYWLLHLEINELLSDYIQSLLCKKPDDVLRFTIDHFKVLTANKIQRA